MTTTPIHTRFIQWLLDMVTRDDLMAETARRDQLAHELHAHEFRIAQLEEELHALKKLLATEIKSFKDYPPF